MSFRNLLLGFIAGAIATVTVHELIKLGLHEAGMIPLSPWSMEPAAITGVPKIASDMFWGGLWGAIFAAIAGALPGPLTVQGLIFGILGPAVLGVFVLVPLITARFPLFFGGDTTLIASVILILAGWGVATALLYGWFGGTQPAASV